MNVINIGSYYYSIIPGQENQMEKLVTELKAIIKDADRRLWVVKGVNIWLR